LRRNKRYTDPCSQQKFRSSAAVRAVRAGLAAARLLKLRHPSWEVESIDRVTTLCRLLDAEADIDAVVLYFTFGDRLRDAYRTLADTAAELPTPTWLVWAAAPPGAVEAAGRSDVVVSSIGAAVRQVAALVDRAARVLPNAFWRCEPKPTISSARSPTSSPPPDPSSWNCQESAPSAPPKSSSAGHIRAGSAPKRLSLPSLEPHRSRPHLA